MVNARMGAGGDVFDDLVPQITHVDDGVGDAGRGKLVEHMVEQRAARHANQRLRHVVVSGAAGGPIRPREPWLCWG